jgi:hypothetical protein
MQIALAKSELSESSIRQYCLITKKRMADAQNLEPVATKLVKVGEPGKAYNIGSAYALPIKDLHQVSRHRRLL